MTRRLAAFAGLAGCLLILVVFGVPRLLPESVKTFCGLLSPADDELDTAALRVIAKAQPKTEADISRLRGWIAGLEDPNLAALYTKWLDATERNLRGGPERDKAEREKQSRIAELVKCLPQPPASP